MHMSPGNRATKRRLQEQRRPEGISRPKCGSTNDQKNDKHKTMANRCRSCRRFCSVEIGTDMEASILGDQFWAIAIYLLHTGIKGPSRMNLGIAYPSAWSETSLPLQSQPD